MKPLIRVTLTLVIILVLAAGFYLVSKKITAVTGKGILGSIIKSDYDDFAKCLSGKGIKLYVREGHPYCEQQKDEFEGAAKHLIIIECLEQRELCSEKQIQSFPAWEINQRMYLGKKNLETLSQISGCKLL